MSNPTGQAMEHLQQHPATVIQQQYAQRIASMVPSHVNGQAWVRQLQGVLRDEKLAAAAASDFASLLAAAERAAQLGLRPGTEEFYLIPRKIKGRLQVQGIVGYQGLVDLMYRSGAVSSVVVEVVREADDFTYSPGRHQRPLHDIDWDKTDRGPLRLAYAYAEMMGGGTSKVVVIPRQEMYDEHRAKSDGYMGVWRNGKLYKDEVNPHSPWVQFEGSMWLKSAARVLAKWVPTSTEYRAQTAQADHVAAQVVATAAAIGQQQPAIAVPDVPALPVGVDPVTGEITSVAGLLDDGPAEWFCEEHQEPHTGPCPLEPAGEIR